MMLKKLIELNKDEKIELIRDIAAGKISKRTDQTTLFATERGDAFLGLAVKADNNDVEVVCVGTAAKEALNLIARLLPG